MEQVRLYRISLVPILGFIGFGLILCLIGILAFLQEPSFSTIGLIFPPFIFIGYGVYLWKKRNQGKGFFWDDEGIVIDLNGSKVYWNEIESIEYRKGFRGTNATVIYPYYTSQEKIRIRRKKKMPTNAHSIEWFLIEKPREYHPNLMKVWEEKK